MIKALRQVTYGISSYQVPLNSPLFQFSIIRKQTCYRIRRKTFEGAPRTVACMHGTPDTAVLSEHDVLVPNLDVSANGFAKLLTFVAGNPTGYSLHALSTDGFVVAYRAQFPCSGNSTQLNMATVRQMLYRLCVRLSVLTAKLS